MLIDSTQPEETRVVVHNGDRIEEFDYEVGSRKQLKGNIYLAKVTRVEPSLQAAFVDYGGNRHGFLPFSEIHPDYYRIPIADRQKLVDAEAAALSDIDDDDEVTDDDNDTRPPGNGADRQSGEEGDGGDAQAARAAGEDGEEPEVKQIDTEESVDSVGGDEIEDAERRRAQMLRRYKIQEVIKRRQILLVQVTKEERGNKGAALTSYLSLAGRYCVLMPNTNKGGGISRKISNANDRRRLKKILAELEIPKGIAVIVRTAGSQRSKAEIRRDFEYLMRLWNEIRETTFQSTAPELIHEEANLIKRAIRDLYSREMEEVIVDGEEGYKAAKAFMKSLMPSHAKRVSLFKNGGTSLFQRYRIERHIEAMHSPVVTLRSGGYIVLNTTEALVAIDVNSGKATRERNIEETALKTNLEAAEEIGRQLRLRDLAGLIVIDFIDMEEMRHNREVERRLKEALRFDRARIQLGRISHFGLLEMSRQRLRPSLFESANTPCPHCQGIGFVRTTESLALQVLRTLEEEATRRGEGAVTITASPDLALYLLNQKRQHVVDFETRHNLALEVVAENNLPSADIRILYDGERIMLPSQIPMDQAASADGSARRGRRRRGRKRTDGEKPEAEIQSEGQEEAAAPPSEASAQTAGEDDEASKKRRRRGKRGGRRRARRTTADAVEAGESQDQAVTDRTGEESPPATATGDDAGQVVAGEPTEETAEVSKPKRRSRRRKTASAPETPSPDTPSPETPAKAQSDSTEQSETPASDEATASPSQKAANGETDAGPPARAKRKPRARPRKRAEANKDKATNGNFGEETPKADAEPSETPTEPSETPAEPSETPTEPSEAPTVADSSPEPDKADQGQVASKRRGWWNRLV
jgi:ribonuclease E